MYSEAPRSLRKYNSHFNTIATIYHLYDEEKEVFPTKVADKMGQDPTAISAQIKNNLDKFDLVNTEKSGRKLLVEPNREGLGSLFVEYMNEQLREFNDLSKFLDEDHSEQSHFDNFFREEERLEIKKEHLGLVSEFLSSLLTRYGSQLYNPSARVAEELDWSLGTYFRAVATNGYNLEEGMDIIQEDPSFDLVQIQKFKEILFKGRRLSHTPAESSYLTFLSLPVLLEDVAESESLDVISEYEDNQM